MTQGSPWGLLVYGLFVMALEFAPLGGINPKEVAEYLSAINVGIKGVIPGEPTEKFITSQLLRCKFWVRALVGYFACNLHCVKVLLLTSTRVVRCCSTNHTAQARQDMKMASHQHTVTTAGRLGSGHAGGVCTAVRHGVPPNAGGVVECHLSAHHRGHRHAEQQAGEEREGAFFCITGFAYVS